MSAVIDIVTPVFGVVLLGFGLARIGLFDEHTGEGLTKFMYYVAIPAMLFRSLAAADLPHTIPWRFLTAFYAPSLLLFGVGMLLARFALHWDPRSQGIAGMASSYSNMFLLGFPLVVTAFGDEANLPLFILLATQSMVLFPTATCAIEIDRIRAQGGIGALVRSILKLMLNPVILSLGLGVVANVIQLSIPAPAAKILATISAAGPGCALVALGISLGQYRLSGGLRETAVIVLLKNLVYPAMVWGACHLLDVAPDWARVAVLLAAMPTGVNVFIYARKYKLQVAAITKTIVVSTAVSVVVASWLLHRSLG